MRKLKIIATVLFTLFITQCKSTQTDDTMTDHKNNPYYSRTDTTQLKVSDAEWKKILPKEVYNIAREKGTEWAFSGKYWKTDDKGTY